MIIDISHHQPPSAIDYEKLAKQVQLVIIRTQYGSKLVDKHYKIHHVEFKKRAVPTASYAWVRGASISDMEVEATDFYNRTKEFEPTFWFLDVEEKSMQDMRVGIKAYVKKLRELGAKKVGVYIAHHLYKQFNLDMNDFNAVWIPRYGTNNGQPQVKPDFPCDIWQYTSSGKLDGYNGDLDFNRLMGTKPLEFFTGGANKTAEELDTIKIDLHGKPLEANGIYKNNTNYIPVRFLERLGYKIGWNKGVVVINYNEDPPIEALD